MWLIDISGGIETYVRHLCALALGDAKQRNSHNGGLGGHGARHHDHAISTRQLQLHLRERL